MRPLTLARSKTFPPVSAHQRERAWSRTGYGQPHTGSRGSVHYNVPARLTCPASERNERTRRADATCRCRWALRSRTPAHGRSQRRPAPQKAAVVRLCVPGVSPPRRVAGSWSFVSGGHAVTQRGEQAGKGGGEVDTDVCQRGFLRVQARQRLRGVSGLPERSGQRDCGDDEVAGLLRRQMSSTGDGFLKGAQYRTDGEFESVYAFVGHFPLEIQGDVGEQVTEQGTLDEGGSHRLREIGRRQAVAAVDPIGQCLRPLGITLLGETEEDFLARFEVAAYCRHVYAGLGRDRGQRHRAHPVSGGQGARGLHQVGDALLLVLW